jgi:uncharacterized protein (DUF1697 family)
MPKDKKAAAPTRSPKRAAGPSGRMVALLRGVNVGGRNMVPMAALRQAFASLGLDEVTTYIQSGNVLFRAASGREEALAERLTHHLHRTFGPHLTLVLRSAEELARVAASSPFDPSQVDTARLMVFFLGARPAPGAIAALDPDRSPPDAFKVVGREIHAHCPNGFAKTKLTVDYFERRLGTVATARNWRTVNALAARSKGGASPA